MSAWIKFRLMPTSNNMHEQLDKNVPNIKQSPHCKQESFAK